MSVQGSIKDGDREAAKIVVLLLQLAGGILFLVGLATVVGSITGALPGQAHEGLSILLSGVYVAVFGSLWVSP